MKKSKLIVLTTVLCVGASVLAACTKKAQETTAALTTTAESSAETTTEQPMTTDGDKIQVVSTIFPGYDWAREIIGEKMDDYELTYLMDKGMDLHSFQPSAADISKIKSADLFIYVGGESDAWVDEVLKDSMNSKQQVINLVEVLGDKALDEEVKEGMEDHDHADHDHEGENHDHEHEGEDHDHDHEGEGHDHDHDHEGEDHDHDHDHEDVKDEHVWLSLKNAQVFVQEITKALVYVDAKNADGLKENEQMYLEELQNLDAAYQSAVDGANVKTVLFGDRFPFRYLVDDYGLDYYAAFVGCSTDTEASFETVTFLSKKVDELALKNIFIIENSDGKLAKTITENTADKSQNTIVLDSLQSVSKKDIEDGKSYLGVMTQNLEVLRSALANE